MQPLTQPDRYVPIDVLRGLALYGVLIVNLLTLFRVSLFSHILDADRPEDALGRLLADVVAILMEFKAFTLFSFLFGVGVAVQAERAGQRGGVSVFLLRRFLVLLSFGLIHLYLIWNGDILALYGVCGLLLIPLLRLPVTWILISAVLLLVSSTLGIIPLQLPDTLVLRAHASEAARIYSSGGMAEILAFRWRETNQLMAPLLLMTLPRTLAVMLLGVAAWRTELLTARRKLWTPILAAAALVAVVGGYLHIGIAAQLGLAFAYAAAVLLWIPKAPLLAAGGQMALTNYLTQSIVAGVVFYGYGFGQFGRAGVAATIAGGTMLYLSQLFMSYWWLRRFRFGPFEWLWRTLTYGRRQPMRITS